MKISLISGGLGNQIYHYIFAKFIEEYTHEPVLLDNTFFYKNKVHNGFEIDKIFLNSKLNLLSEYFAYDEWEYILKKVGDNSLPYFIQKNFSFIGEYVTDKTILYIAQTQPVLTKVIQPYQFEPNIVNISAPNIYYYGYWQNDDYLNKSKGKQKVLKELQFEPITDDSNKKYYDNIINSNSIGVHIRRGDFINLGWSKECNEYCIAVNQMKNKLFENDITNTVYFIFSDDIEWCENNRKELGFTSKDEVVFVEGNSGNGNNYIDIQLMSNCKYLVLTKKSSFSRISKLFNQNLIDYVEV